MFSQREVIIAEAGGSPQGVLEKKALSPAAGPSVGQKQSRKGPELEKEKKMPNSESWTKWLVGTVGIPALFVAIGYIIDQSQERLLGVSVHGFDGKVYTGVASEFFCNLGNSVLDWKVLLTILGIAVIFVGSQLLHFRHTTWQPKRRHLSQLSLVLAVAFLSIAKIAVYDFPVSGATNLLTDDIGIIRKEISAAPSVKGMIVCSHDPSNQSQACTEGFTTYRAGVRDFFLADMGWTTLVCALGMVYLRFARGTVVAPDGPFWEGWASRGLIIVLLIISVYGMLNVYGRTLEPVEFPYGDISLAPEVGSSPEEQEPLPQHVMVLTSEGDEYVFLNQGDGALWHVPKSLVRSFVLGKNQDAVSFHIQRAAADHN